MFGGERGARRERAALAGGGDVRGDPAGQRLDDAPRGHVALRQRSREGGVLTDRNELAAQLVASERAIDGGGVRFPQLLDQRQVGTREHAPPREERGLGPVHRRDRAPDLLG